MNIRSASTFNASFTILQSVSPRERQEDECGTVTLDVVVLKTKAGSRTVNLRKIFTM